MHGWKKGVLLGLFSSLLWEPHAVEAAVGKKVDPTFLADFSVQTAATLEATAETDRGSDPHSDYGEWVFPSQSQPSIDLMKLLSKSASKTAANSSAGVNSERTALQEQKQFEQERQASDLVAQQAGGPNGVLASRGQLTTTYTPPAPPTPPTTVGTSNPTQQSNRAQTAPNGGTFSNDAPTLMKSSGVSSTQGSRAVTIALQDLGVPYRYGGTTPSGFDCSGFLQYVWQQVDVNLPRTTYQQINAGTPVARANLRPGDLLFFSCNGQATSHSGMYVGNGKFVHADLDRGIAIADLNSSYWSSVYEAAVRVQ